MLVGQLQHTGQDMQNELKHIKFAILWGYNLDQPADQGGSME